MSAIKKALRSSMRHRRYAMFDQKENDYIHTPNTTVRRRNASESNAEDKRISDSFAFRRGSRVTRSFRDAVGVIRQRIRMSTKQRPSQQSKITTPKRQHNSGEVHLYSPFHIETPKKGGRVARRTHIRTSVNMETPTRLKREVEALTANMQALSALTPNTLHERRQSSSRICRKELPLTNGSLRTPKQTRHLIHSVFDSK